MPRTRTLQTKKEEPRPVIAAIPEIDAEIAGSDDKAEIESPLAEAEESEDLAPEEASLDDEELNSFGDKWEE